MGDYRSGACEDKLAIVTGASKVIGKFITRQLLSFARAMLADPPILILDEATSNIDTRREAMIEKALKRLLAGRTSLAIAHRLSTVQNADQILVIEDGHIAERGTHASLLAAGGLYADLYHQFHRPVDSAPSD